VVRPAASDVLRHRPLLWSAVVFIAQFRLDGGEALLTDRRDARAPNLRVTVIVLWGGGPGNIADARRILVELYALPDVTGRPLPVAIRALHSAVSFRIGQAHW